MRKKKNHGEARRPSFRRQQEWGELQRQESRIRVRFAEKVQEGSARWLRE